MKAGILKGNYQLVYITPELLVGSSIWRKMLAGDVYKKRESLVLADSDMLAIKNATDFTMYWSSITNQHPGPLGFVQLSFDDIYDRP